MPGKALNSCRRLDLPFTVKVLICSCKQNNSIDYTYIVNSRVEVVAHGDPAHSAV